MSQPSRPAFRWRGLVVGVPLAVWLVTVTFGAVLAAWTVLTPAYQAPDEPNHVDRALATAHGQVLIPPKSRHTGIGVVRSERVAGIPSCCPPPAGQPLELDEAPPHDQRPSIASLGGGAQRPGTDVNQITAHPPLYYLWEGAIAKALPDSWSYDKTLEGLRFASLLLVVPLPLLTYAAARRLAGPGPVPVTAAVLPLAIPMLSHLGASVTNDSMLVLLGGLLTVLTSYIATGDTSRRTAAWTGVMLAAALLTKAFGFVGFFAVGLAYAVAWARALRARQPEPALGVAAAARTTLAGVDQPAVEHRSAGRRPAGRHAVGQGRARAALVGRAPLGGAIIALGLGVLGGGWYWARNAVVYGAVQPDGGAYVPPPAPPSWHPSIWEHVFHGYPSRLMTSFFGNFGWLADPLPTAVVAASVAVLLVGITLSFRLRPTRERPWSWADVTVVVLPAFLLFWSVGWQSWQGWRLRESIGADQGRYLYFGLAGLLVAVALGLGRLPRPARRWVPLGAFAVAAGYQAYAALNVLDFFWGPRASDLAYQIRNAVAWSVWSGTELAVLAGVATVVAIFAVVALCLPDRRPAGPPRPHDRGRLSEALSLLSRP